jgi:hypothetical protein
VDAVADGDDVWKFTVAVWVRVMPSVVSVAVKVTDSATESVTEKETWPFEPVVAGEGVPTTAVPELAWRPTTFPDTGLLLDESRVTTAVAPVGPTRAGDTAVTVDCAAETTRVPNVTEAVFVTAVLEVASVAVKVSVSAVVSVAVKVATPCAFVVLGVAAGVMVACPPP